MTKKKRILFVVPPFTGHINPTRGVGEALLQAGYDVSWCGYPHTLHKLPDGATVFPLATEDPQGAADEITDASLNLRGLRSVKFFYESVVVPMTRDMLPGVRAVVEQLQPDLIISDQQALAGGFVAREKGIPWISSSTTSASVVEPLQEFAKIIEWRDGLMASLQKQAGLEVWRRPGLSPYGALVFSTAELVRGDVPKNTVFIGPVATARPSVDFPWDELRDTQRVLVSLGTVSFYRGAAFYRAVVEGLGGLDLQVILVAPEALVPEVPENFIRADFVPQVELLPHLDAVVSHGGHNTMVESLGAGLPMVLAPIRDDQPVVAAQVVAAGAGIRVKFGRVRANRMRDAVMEVLSNPSYRQAAVRVADSFRKASGAAGAVELVGKVLQGA